MTQKIHTIQGGNLEEALAKMREAYGEDAIVLRTASVSETGLRGLFGRRKVELTISTDQEEPGQRKPSPVELKYMGAGRVPVGPAPVGSDERFATTVAHFQRKLQTGASGHAGDAVATSAPPPAPAAAVKRAPSGGRVESAAIRADHEPIPFRQPDSQARTVEALRHELREMREALDVLVAETPGGGLPPELAPYYRDLTARGVARKLASSLLMRTYKQCQGAGQAGNRDAFLDRLRAEAQAMLGVTGGIRPVPGKCRVVAMVGTTGVGKTTNLAKLAAHFALRQRLSVALITADTYRIGAPQQLKVYADIIGLSMHVVNDAKEMASAIKTCAPHDMVFIDTPGGSQFNVRHLQELRTMLRAARPDDIMLALPVGGYMDDLRFIVENYSVLQPNSVVFTKLDETRKYGAMLSIVHETGWPVSYLSVGQDVPGDIRLAQAGSLADLVVTGRTSRAGSSSPSA